jgi:hypothetical protein
VGDIPFDLAERSANRLPIVQRESVSDQKMGNWVDVSPNRVCAQLKRLAYRRAAAHERIEHDSVLDPSALVKQAHHVCSTRSERADYDRPESRAEAMRPPLMDVV